MAAFISLNLSFTHTLSSPTFCLALYQKQALYSSYSFELLRYIEIITQCVGVWVGGDKLETVFDIATIQFFSPSPKLLSHSVFCFLYQLYKPMLSIGGLSHRDQLKHF